MNNQASKYDLDLEKCSANYVPLSPTSLVRRSANAFPEHVALSYEGQQWTWREVLDRSRKLAGAFRQSGGGRDTTIAALCRNIPAAVELSYAVPMSGCVLNMINTRLDAQGVAFILDHGEAEFFIIDAALLDIAEAALEQCASQPQVILVGESSQKYTDYEVFIDGGKAIGADDLLPDDEWDSIALNYTSGTTGNPKGVVYHHRGAYLNALGNALEWSMPQHPRYLWTLPLFHCNGWCFPWTVAAKAGTNICLAAPVPEDVVDALLTEDVTHFCCAPIVLNMVLRECETRNLRLEKNVRVMLAGAAPPEALIARAEVVGFDITHVYGLTEVYGPTAISAWRTEWDDLPIEERARKKARQGVNYTVLEELNVRDGNTLEPCADNGEDIGEITFRGNVVMKGYLKNPKATREAFEGGYFRSGDLAVKHPDGHAEIKDRSKDIIISGGENISSIEVENIIYQHPDVLECAVVAAPHEKWGETPVAFIEKKPESNITEQELISFCRDRLAHFKCPTAVKFDLLPKTSTGKIQKYELRRRLEA